MSLPSPVALAASDRAADVRDVRRSLFSTIASVDCLIDDLGRERERMLKAEPVLMRSARLQIDAAITALLSASDSLQLSRSALPTNFRPEPYVL